MDVYVSMVKPLLSPIYFTGSFCFVFWSFKQQARLQGNEEAGATICHHLYTRFFTSQVKCLISLYPF